MHWVNFLHIYQPADQQPDILEAVAMQSYRPILAGLKKNKKARLTLNINGARLELFDKYNHRDLIDNLRALGESGQIEFTGSAKYHAFLPFLKEDEIIRQVEINNKTNSFYLGKGYKPRGFFPPEMGYKKELAPIIDFLGFSWIILDEIAFNGMPGQVDYTKIYQIKGTKLNVFFRERRMSNLIMSAVARNRETLFDAIDEELNSGKYFITGMDGETFGHHRPGLEKALFEMFTIPELELIQVSDVSKYYHDVIEIEPVASTWASCKEDIDKGIQFLSWSDPTNEIHKWQWDLVNLVTNEVYALNKKDKHYQEIRHRLDIDLASDHFWWASAKPWWSLEMIESGAFHLLETIRKITKISSAKLARASELYEKIISTAFNWQRIGKIRRMAGEHNSLVRIPFHERTIGRGGREKDIYRAFIDMMRGLEKKAAAIGEYEKAILWRDAIYKIEHKWDIYDAINAIDLVRVEIPHEEIERTLDKYTGRYRAIRGGQPEQRGK